MSMAIAYAMKKKANKMAQGGHVHTDECYAHGGCAYMAQGGDVEKVGEVEDDMVSRIMKKREGQYSEGGRVANDDEPVADFEENQFDDLPLDDDLEEHYTGDNSGDELGNEQEDEDQHDIVSRIMRSRRKKDRMPHPA